ncbi:MAG TPA: alpha-galactosidase [Streptosporangiaceae bacterium]
MTDISYDDEHRTWLIQLPSSAYGLGVSADGRVVRHLHWGAPCQLADLVPLAAAEHAGRRTGKIGWGHEEPAEYVPWGGPRYDEPTLKADFADGTRGIESQLTGHDINRDATAVTLTLDLADLAYPLRVRLHYHAFHDSDVLERWATITHTGGSADGPIVLRQAHSANWWLPRREHWRARYLTGGWASETQPAQTMLGPGKFMLESRRGVTSHHLQPYFALDDGTATEEAGEVWGGLLAWSGSFRLVLETTPGGSVHVSGGWNEFDAPIELAPGEELSLPVFAGCYSATGQGGLSRSWHDYQLRHVLGGPDRPKPDGGFPPLRPVLYNSWEATGFDVTEDGQALLAELAAGLGAELFVVDDGWFTGRRDDHAGLGDWVPDPVKFPRGLDPLIDRVHQLDMGFGLWIEPEMVNADSDLYRAHPDWVLHFEHRARSERRNQLVLNLARDDVADWVFGTVDGLLRRHQIDFIKWDMNRHFSEPGWPDRAGHNPERMWVDYVRHLYSILDRLRAAHPGVAFEACAGGGARIDLGILARSDQAWTSDNTDAWDRIPIQEGFSHAYPAQAMVCWVTDSPNPLTGRRLPLSYRFHVAMSGTLGLGGNLSEWTEDERIEARQLVARYKEIRPVVQHGRQYRLASTQDGPLGAVQYRSADGDRIGDRVVVLAWTGVRHFRPWPTRLRLTGLDPEASYRDEDTGEERTGASLMQLGMKLPDDLDYASLLVRLERLG